MNKLDKDTKALDKAIKVLDSQARNAAGILLGELVKKSGNKYVLKDKWGEQNIWYQRTTTDGLLKARKLLP